MRKKSIRKMSTFIDKPPSDDEENGQEDKN